MRIPMKTLIASLVMAASFFACGAASAGLSRDEAERVLLDTFFIAGYTGLNGESDYAGKPGNIICAALFGAYDAKMGYVYEQDLRKENGQEPLAEDMPLFTVDGRPFLPGSVVLRDEYPALFRAMPPEYTAFVSRTAAELAALRFTGHSIAEHGAPPAQSVLGDTRVTGKGYFLALDGLGDLPQDVVLKTAEEKDGCCVMRGEVIDFNAEDGDAPVTFELTLQPGEVPGTWKRQYSETSRR